MEETGKHITFGEMVQRNLLDPFVEASTKLHQIQDPHDPDLEALLELSDALVYDEATCNFSLVYEVLGKNERVISKTSIPVPWDEVDALTKRIQEYIETASLNVQ